MILPESIPQMLGQGNDETIKAMLANPEDHLQNIMRLSTVCNVKVKFASPVDILINTRKFKKNVVEYTFTDFFMSSGMLCYKFKKGGRRGNYLPIRLVESYEPVITSVDKFDNYEQFSKKFDTQFITEEFIEQLWNEPSSQTGEQYRPSDFKPISQAGKKALSQFLKYFHGVESTDTSKYFKTSDFNGGAAYHILDADYRGTGGSSTSRDISISHKLGTNKVFYSSEYHGCGNGRYGIIATKSTYLHLEDD
jgi:hypothetical protein